MKVTVLAMGSLGDVRPCLNLGKRLHERGHEFTLVAYKEFEAFARDKYSFANFVGIDGTADDLMSVIMDENGFSFKTFTGLIDALGKHKDELLEKLLICCKEADMLIYVTSSSSCLCYVAEYLKKPYMRVSFWPESPTRDHQTVGWPKWPVAFLRGAYNIYSHWVALYCTSIIYKKAFGVWRKQLNLPFSERYTLTRLDGKRIPKLYAFSENVIPRFRDYGNHICITGYWIDLDASTEFTPDPKLAEFLAAGEPPIYVGFGSMTSQLKGGIEYVVEALRRYGRRTLLAIKPDQYDPSKLPENVFMLGYTPHEWLFPRVSAVVHHGGAGSTAAGLRAGKPTLTIPFGSDQHIWGDLIHKAGMGPKPISRVDLTADNFLAAIQELDNPETVENARLLGEKLRREDGIGKACDYIEEYYSKC